jgi:ABC-2 type transport system permease protein
MHSAATTDQAFSTTPTARGASQPTVSFMATLGSEWMKFASIRSMWLMAVLALILTVGITGLLSWVTGWSFDDWGDADRASFDPISFSIVGLVFGGILFVVMGVQLVSAEYSSGMIRQTFTTTPKRGRVLLAKALVITIASLVLGTIVTLASFYTGQFIFEAYDMNTVSLSDGDARRTILTMIATTPMFPLMGVAAAFLLRSAAGAITLILGLLFVPSMFGGLLPRRWQEDVMAFLPGSLADSLAFHHIDSDNPLYADPAIAAVGVIAWIVASLGLALIVLNKRDV